MTRLRIVGKRTKDGVELEPAREEERLAGSGAPYATGLVAVALDARGRLLKELPIKSVNDSEEAAFELLLPVSPDVQAIQIRDRHEVVAELKRPNGVPSLTNFGLDDGAPILHWTYGHTKLARPALQLELIDDTATYAFSVDSCAEDYRIPTQRLPARRDLRIRLVASDGWNKAVSPSEPLATTDSTLILRRVTANRWFAETNLSGRFRWTLDGETLMRSSQEPIDGRIVDLDTSARGILEVRALDAGSAIADTRVLGEATDG